MDEAAEPGPRGYRSRAVTEIWIYAVSSVVVLYVLAGGWLLVAVSNQELSSTEAVAGLIAWGLAAPVCPWALRVAIRLQATQSSRQEPGALSGIPWRPGPWLRRWAAKRGGPAASAASHRWLSPARTLDLGIAVVSLALFWAFYTGSLTAALLVPVTVHLLRWSRRR